MADVKECCNCVKLVGVVEEKFKLLTEFKTKSGENEEKRLYRGVIATKRPRIGYDYVPVIIGEELFNEISREYIKLDADDKLRVEITGTIRSHNEFNEVLNKDVVSVFIYAKSIKKTEYAMDINEAILRGFICKKTIFRKTPSGKSITDVMLKVKTSKYKYHYIPTICWQKNAKLAGRLDTGAKLEVVGRFQSRSYNKVYEDGTVEKKWAYEMCCEGIYILEPVFKAKDDETIKEMVYNLD